MFYFVQTFLLTLTLAFLSSSAFAQTPESPQSPTQTASQNAATPNASQSSQNLELAAALKREEELRVELEKYKRQAAPTPSEPKDLLSSVQKDFQTKREQTSQTKALEKALSFNMSVQSYVDGNKDLFPQEIPAIVKKAQSEHFDSEEQKAAVLKEALIQSYFSVQANKDVLTKHQAGMLDDFLKLTKNGREAKAAEIFENVFEPAVELVRRVKKAEELSRARNGYAPITDVMEGYKQRLIARWNQKHNRTRAV